MADDGAPASAIREVLKICNEKGLHARAAAKFVKCAAGWDAEVTVQKGGVSVGGTSIMGLLLLAAAKGSEIEVSATGAEAMQAVGALKALVADRFEEDH